MYSNPSHGGNTGARWAELQRQEADVVAALQDELKAAQATIEAQRGILKSYEDGSYLLITTYRETLEIVPEGCLSVERLDHLAQRRVSEINGDATRASVEGYHITALGHIKFVRSYL